MSTLHASSAPATLTDELGATVLVLVSGWSAMSPTARREVTQALVRADAGARRPVVWSAEVLSPDDRRDLESVGAVVFEADPAAGPVGAPATCTTNPAPAQLLAALEPDLVVFASATVLAAQYPFLASALGIRPVLAWTAQEILDPTLAARVDDVVRGPGLAVAVERALTRPPAQAGAPQVARIEAVGVLAGTVSVVIPVWNRWDLTEACLASLRAGGGGPLEIIVVDNGSTDETAAGLAAQPDVTVLRNPENLGFPRAVNQGLRASRGEWVCVLNNDTEVVPGWLDELQATLALPGTGIVGPRSNAISGSQVVAGAPATAQRAAAHAWGAAWTDAHRGVAWRTSRLVGFCLLARRDLFVEVGGFDERFGIGNFEDDELCTRVAAAGLTLRVADGSVVLHHGSATFAALGLDYARVMFEAGRRAPGMRLRSGPVDGLVLADADPGAAFRSAASLLAVVDRVRVLARLDAPRVDLAVAGLRALGHDVEVVAVDWADPADPAVAFAGLSGDAVVVVAAGEEVMAPEPGRARQHLQALAVSGPCDLVVAGRPETRVAPAGPEAFALIGASTGRLVPPALLSLR